MNMLKLLLVATLMMVPLHVASGSGCGPCPGDEVKADDCGACPSSKADCGSACGGETAKEEPAKAAASAEPAKEPAKDHEHAAFPTVTGEELATMIADKAPVIILDARSGKWDDGKRIPGAKQLTAEATEEEVAKLVPAKDAKVVTYCSNLKCPASLHLAEHLKKLGYTNVTNYPGGLEDWLKAGKEVVTETK